MIPTLTPAELYALARKTVAARKHRRLTAVEREDAVSELVEDGLVTLAAYAADDLAGVVALNMRRAYGRFEWRHSKLAAAEVVSDPAACPDTAATVDTYFAETDLAFTYDVA